MTSDSPNEDPGVAAKAVKPQPTDRRVAWEYQGQGGREPGLRSLPRVRLGTAWLGVVVAAACYPIVVGSVSAIYSWLVYGQAGIHTSEIGMLIFVWVISFIFGSIFGSIYAVFMSIPAWFLTQVLSWGLKGIVSDRGVNAIFGGLTGFLCISLAR